MTGFLSSYRVLDLSDERGLLAGHMFAQLGADVVQVEPLGGSGARRIGPFAADAPAGENSLYWSAYASGKRGLVCDLQSEAGRVLLKRLIEKADFLIESADPGVMEKLGFGPIQNRAINPALIHVSITAFGSDGPKAHWPATDITVWAAGGSLLPCRDGTRPPLRMSVPQTFLNAAADAANGALIAHFARLRTGRGQHVDVSAQESVALTTLSVSLGAAYGHPDFTPGSGGARKKEGKKELDLSGSGSRTRRSKWKVKDGLVEMHLGIGPGGRFTNNLFAWIKAEGACDADIADWDWMALPKQLRAGEITDEDMERARTQVAAFLARYTREEILEQAIPRRIFCAPVATTADLIESRQLRSRNFFEVVEEPGGRRRLLPGAFIAGVPGACVPLRPAPAIGEHTAEVSRDWLGLRDGESHDLPVHQRDGQIRPFAKLRVLDLAWVVAGPLIGRVLADFGAEVIRIESSRRIETARAMGPFPGGKMDPQKSGLFENCNAGKYGMTLDLTQEGGRAIVRDLVAWADVVVESFSPGQMREWGLGYDALKDIKPDLIMLSTSLMGQTGPWTNFAGFGNLGAAIAGYQAIVGWPDALPVGPFGPYTDFAGPRYSLMSLLAALDHRRRTGVGCWLDISQAEAGVQFLAPQIADYAVNGRVVALQGNHDAAMSPHGVYRCQPTAPNGEGWVAIAVRNDDEWLRLAARMGGEDLVKDGRFATLAARKAHETELDALVDAWTAGQTAAAIEEALLGMDIPVHNVASSDDMLVDPQLSIRNHYLRMPHALMGETIFENARYRLSETPAIVSRPAPHFGRDQQYILGEILGYDAARIAALEEAGLLV